MVEIETLKGRMLVYCKYGLEEGIVRCENCPKFKTGECELLTLNNRT